MEDLHAVGGIPAVMKYLLKNNLLHGECLTVTGKTVAENLANVPDLNKGQNVFLDVKDPLKPTGHLQVLYGNLASEGSVAKISGNEGDYFEGIAKVFDDEIAISKDDKVTVYATENEQDAKRVFEKLSENKNLKYILN